MSINKNIFDRYAFFLIFFICLLKELYLSIDYFLHPSFWAEDGIYLISDLLCKTGTNLLTPVISTMAVYERVLIAIFFYFSPLYTPQLILFSSLLVSTFTYCLIVHPRFSWLIPNIFLRILIALIFCFAGLTEEVNSNLIGFTYIGTLLLFLTVLMKPRLNPILFLMLWIIIPLSSNLSLILLPMLAILYYQQREKILIIPMLSCLTTALFNFYLSFNSNLKILIPRKFNFIDTALTATDRLIFEAVSMPFFGPHVAIHFLNYSKIISFLASLVLFFSFIVILFRSKCDLKIKQIILAILSIIFVYIIAQTIARPEMNISPYLKQETNYSQRHITIPFFAIIIAFSILLSNLKIQTNLFFKVISKLVLLLPLVSILTNSYMTFNLCYKPIVPNEWNDFIYSYELAKNSNEISSFTGKLIFGPLVQSPDRKSCISWAGLKVRKNAENFICEIVGGPY